VARREHGGERPRKTHGKEEHSLARDVLGPHLLQIKPHGSPPSLLRERRKTAQAERGASGGIATYACFMPVCDSFDKHACLPPRYPPLRQGKALY